MLLAAHNTFNNTIHATVTDISSKQKFPSWHSYKHFAVASCMYRDNINSVAAAL